MSKTKEKAVCIFSGGMDSTTLIYQLSLVYDVYAITIDYGQRHKKEIKYAKRTTKKLKIPHKIVDISKISKLLKSSLIDKKIDIPEGHYKEESMKSTVVPNRNMIMLSVAIGYAGSIGAKKVFYANHSGDHAIYPDCRTEFVEKMNDVSKIAHYEPIEIISPYLHLSKGDIAVIGKKLGVPYEDTWTCYKGKRKPCKKCSACIERMEAMKFAGVNDKQYKK